MLVVCFGVLLLSYVLISRVFMIILSSRLVRCFIKLRKCGL